MEYKSDRVLDKFIEEFGDYGLPKEELRKVIGSPWRMLRDTMDNEEDAEVRLIYFGSFKPIKKRNNEKSKS